MWWLQSVGTTPPRPEYPPGFGLKIKIAGFRLALVLEIFVIIYEMTYI